MADYMWAEKTARKAREIMPNYSNVELELHEAITTFAIRHGLSFAEAVETIYEVTFGKKSLRGIWAVQVR